MCPEFHILRKGKETKKKKQALKAVLHHVSVYLFPEAAHTLQNEPFETPAA